MYVFFVRSGTASYIGNDELPHRKRFYKTESSNGACGDRENTSATLSTPPGGAAQTEEDVEWWFIWLRTQ